jgi:hypothetical protein
MVYRVMFGILRFTTRMEIPNLENIFTFFYVPGSSTTLKTLERI